MRVATKFSITAEIDRYILRMNSPNRHKEYVANRISTASPLELIRILYEAGVQSVDEALAALRSGDIFDRGRAITKAIEILSELNASLKHDGHEEYSNTLAELYGYMQQQLIRAHSEKSENRLLEVSRLLRTLLEGWVGAMDNIQGGRGPEREHESVEHAALISGSNPYSLEGAAAQGRSWQL
jgi:flagellar protein FliS